VLRRAHANLERGVRERTAELVQANQALRDSQQLLQALMDNLSTVVFVKDLQGRYILVNPAFEQLFKLIPNSIIGRTDYDLFLRETADAYRAGDRLALDSGVSQQIEESVPTAGGVRTFLTIKTPLRDASGKPYAVVGIAADITERKHLDEQIKHLQKMEAVGRLAGGIAHDFNNLLGVIVGYCDLLRTSLTDSPTQLEQLMKVIKAATQAATLTRNLLTFSRRQVTSQEVFDLNVIIREIEPMVRSVAGEKIALHLRVGDKPYLIRAERDRMEQAILNLVLNARDAMPYGGKLTLTAAGVVVEQGFARLNPPLRPGSHVQLTVRDTGHGMSPEILSHIFEPFFTTKQPRKGTGLGLAMVYGTVQQAGGAILVESEPERGTTFRVYLPRLKRAVLVDKPQLVGGAPKGGTETILLAEDEGGIRNLISEALRLNGYTVLAARHGREAMALAEGHPKRIDLLISDLVMPKMGGRELAQAISSSHPETKLLFISGYSESSSAPPSDGVEVMEKPFTPNALLRKLRTMFDAPRVDTLRA
jgi:PAS domain S-box-containing protein